MKKLLIAILFLFPLYASAAYEINGVTKTKKQYNDEKTAVTAKVASKVPLSFQDIKTWLGIVNREIWLCNLTFKNATTENIIQVINDSLAGCDK